MEQTLSLTVLAPNEVGQTLAELVGVPSRIAQLRQSSMKDTFCKRYFAFKHRLGLSRPGYASARENGSLYHEIVGALHMGKSWEDAIAQGKALADQMLKDITEFADDTLEQDLQNIEQSLQNDWAKACAMAKAYWSRFSLDPDRWKVIAVELPVQFGLIVDAGLDEAHNEVLEIFDPEMTVDLVLYDTVKNEVWIIDHKTVSFDPRIYQQTAPYDPQTRLYRLGVTTYIQSGQAASFPDGEVVVAPHTPVTGMMYVPIGRPTIKQKKNQSFEEYLAEIEDWYTATGAHEFTTTGGSQALVPPYPHRFKEPLVTAEFLGQLREYDKLQHMPTYPELFPRSLNNNDCTRRYNKPCPYRELCSSHTALWPGIAKRLFNLEPEKETSCGNT